MTTRTTRTRRTEEIRARLWRWRTNPLRRTGDVVEAWVLLAAWVLAVLGGALAGVTAALNVDHTLTVRRAQVHTVSAVLTGDAKAPSSTTGYDDGRAWETVRWRSADGTVHTGRAEVDAGARAGSRVTVWTDRADRMVPRPLTETESAVQAALTGVLVAPITGAMVWTGGRLVRGCLFRRRLAEWDAEWKRVEPQWRNLSGGRG
ncbi:hypothetical protein [Streptomyces sp. V3I7]|uniref:Rv1733c family protein n=1 Tax=Streptomyces sp. V3I7 TaxID=3042278 RepID=UPI0027870E5F|nr:hypothetical protein [Streptomyces sp. V3I7]MDQ0989165.1 hypothetical protein [Streptomyces sp. V3I7]